MAIVFNTEDNQILENRFERLSALAIRGAVKIACRDNDAMSSLCTSGHLLLGLMKVNGEDRESEEKFRRRMQMVENHLLEGATLPLLIEYIKENVKDIKGQHVELDTKKECFTEDALQALDSAAETGTYDALWVAGLKAYGTINEHLAKFLDWREIIDLLSQTELPAPKVDSILDAMSPCALETMEEAAIVAGSLGYDAVLEPHVMIALLKVQGGAAEDLLRKHSGITSLRQVCQQLEDNFCRATQTRAEPVLFTEENLGPLVKEGLLASLQELANYKKSILNQAGILWAVLRTSRGSALEVCLRTIAPSLQYATLIKDVEKAMLKGDGEERKPLLFPSLEVLPVKVYDLNFEALSNKILSTLGQDEYNLKILRGLHKKQENNVIITGPEGVGKTALVKDFARRNATDEEKSLRRKKMVLVDCEGLMPKDSARCWQILESTFSSRTNTILCIDHFENLFGIGDKDCTGNASVIHYCLKRGRIQIIGIMEDRYYKELINENFVLAELFTSVEMSEPSLELTERILAGQTLEDLESTYKVTIEEAARKKAVQTANSFILSDYFPTKAIRLLRDACEHISFMISQDTGGVEPRVTEQDVVSAAAARTGLPEETIAGTGKDFDYCAALSSSVAGQDAAVRAVGNSLRMIKAGATPKEKPAAVILFSGLTGTGKTELAKAIAQVYSNSHKLIRYDMTQFSLDHSKQGLFGVPPGYVGYEAGGKLINDLNADPYSVVLFDEAEKAHPVIWQSVLTLFDEGWVIDQKNVKAYGNRAIFVLTSNAGQELIRKHYHPNMPPEELEALKKGIRNGLIDYVNRDTGLKPFSPEFVGRITEIVIFSPLSSEAMLQICRIQVDRLAEEWQQDRGKRLIVDEEVITSLAEACYTEDKSSDHTKGGRIVLNNVRNHIQLPSIELMQQDIGRFMKSEGIRVCWNGKETFAYLLEGMSVEISDAMSLALKRLRPVSPQIHGKILHKEMSMWVQEIRSLVAKYGDSEAKAQVEDLIRSSRQVLDEQEKAFSGALEKVRDGLVNTVKSLIEQRSAP